MTRKCSGSIIIGAVMVICTLLVGSSSTPAKEDLRNHWAFQFVTEALSNGIVKGYPDGSLQPDKPCTRAEYSAMLVRFLGVEADVKVYERVPPSFADVPLDYWGKGYFELLWEMGVFKGDGVGRAWPEGNVTRAEAVTLLSRTLTLLGCPPGDGEPVPFADAAEIPDWAADSFSRLSTLGVVLGTDGRARPTVSLTRAEATALLIRALGVLGKRFDLSGVVNDVNRSTGLLLITVQGQSAAVKVAADTAIFCQGQLCGLEKIIQGDQVAIVLNKSTGLAAVCVVE